MSLLRFRLGVVVGGLLTGIALAALVVWAHAAIYRILWQNTSTDLTATQLRACAIGETCIEYPVDCGPEAICETEVDYPEGEVDAWIHAATDDPASWSGPSNLKRITVGPVFEHEVDALK